MEHVSLQQTWWLEWSSCNKMSAYTVCGEAAVVGRIKTLMMSDGLVQLQYRARTNDRFRRLDASLNSHNHQHHHHRHHRCRRKAAVTGPWTACLLALLTQLPRQQRHHIMAPATINSQLLLLLQSPLWHNDVSQYCCLLPVDVSTSRRPSNLHE